MKIGIALLGEVVGLFAEARLLRWKAKHQRNPAPVPSSSGLKKTKSAPEFVFFVPLMSEVAGLAESQVCNPELFAEARPLRRKATHNRNPAPERRARSETRRSTRRHNSRATGRQDLRDVRLLAEPDVRLLAEPDAHGERESQFDDEAQSQSGGQRPTPEGRHTL